MKCPKCEKNNPEGAAFCSHCGTSMTSTLKECDNCHKMNPANATFCNNCGHPLCKVSKVTSYMKLVEKMGMRLVFVLLLFIITCFAYHVYSYFRYDVIPLTSNKIDQEGNILKSDEVYAWLVKDSQGLYRAVSEKADGPSQDKAIDSYQGKVRPACLIFGFLTILFSFIYWKNRTEKG